MIIHLIKLNDFTRKNRNPNEQQLMYRIAMYCNFTALYFNDCVVLHVMSLYYDSTVSQSAIRLANNPAH